MARTGDFVEVITAPETTYGTEGTWDRLLRVKLPINWEPSITNVTDAGQSTGTVGATQVLEADIRESGKITLPAYFNADHAYLIYRLLGDSTSSELETGVYQHVMDSVTISDQDFDIDSSLSIQINESASVPKLLGCKPSAIEISGNSANNDIDVSYEFFGQKVTQDDTTFDKGAITYPTIKDFHWKDLSVSFGDNSLDQKVTAFKIRLANMSTPEWASTGSKYGVELQPKGFMVTGEIKAWYESAYIKTLQSAGTTFDVVFTFENTSTLIGATKYPKVIINVGKAHIVDMPKADLAENTRSLITFQFEGLANTADSNKICTVTAQNTQAAFTDHS